MSCFYANVGTTERQGPCDLDHLIHLYKIKEINEDTLLWTEGMQNWEPMKNCKIGNFVMQPEKFEDDYDVDNDDEEDLDDEDSGDELASRGTIKTSSTGTMETNDASEFDESENIKIDFFLGPPPPLSGILSKMASGMIKNWKKRFFVLEKGALVYYEPIHLKLRGRYSLLGLGIVSGHLTDSPETIRLYSATRPDICLTATSVKLRKRWAASIAHHIQYANYLNDMKKSNGSVDVPILQPSNAMKEINRDPSPAGTRGRKVTVIKLEEDGSASAVPTTTRASLTTTARGSLSGVPSKPEIARRNSANEIKRINSDVSDISTGSGLGGVQLAVRKPSVLVEPEPVERNTTMVLGNENVYTNIARTINSKIPPLCEGWLSKQGQLFPSIRRRYFILDRGVLRYYRTNISDTSNSKNNTVYAHTPLGVLTITFYGITTDTSESIQVTLTPSEKSPSKRKLILYCDNFVERDMWMAALNAHSAYNPAKML